SLESLEDYLLRPLSPYTTNITNVLLYKNKELWIFLQRGILVVDLQFITGIQEENLKNELIIYPNPTFTEININKLIAYSYYKIYNVYGTLVQEGTNLNNLINIQDLPTSIYFIEFYFNNQFLLSQKFIKL
ncbi:MAG TPA: T9SS type A sorting domain-containing protein, partial [Bacteroidota bacterium]|nr:T9SS type A sorting domain-containing protein [Bacteroidota bacterium]